jgi:hypothetical protein
MQNRTFILMWRHGVSPEIRWFLRGIRVRQDGSFYGELLSAWELTWIIDGSPAKGIGKTIEGRLSPADCSRFIELVAGIGSPGAEPRDGWTGLLAEGPINAPVSRFYYVPGAEKTSSEAWQFLAAIELLEGYMRLYYADLNECWNTI